MKTTFLPWIEKNLDKIHWEGLSCNINAISILEKNVDKIDWEGLSDNLESHQCIRRSDSYRKVFIALLISTFLHPPLIVSSLYYYLHIADVDHFLNVNYPFTKRNFNVTLASIG